MLVYLRLFKESFSFALNALRNNKLRTFLSLLGITIGIFSIIAVLAAVDSLDRSIKDDLSGLDKNTMYLTKYSFGPTEVPRWQRDNFPQTEYDDFVFIERNVPDIEAVAYVIFDSPETIKYQGETVSGVSVTPVSSGIYEIEDFKVEQGRFYTESESFTGAPVIVLGNEIAENLFQELNPIGKQVRVYGRKLTVIGVLKKFGSTIFDSPDDKAYVPANFVRRFRNGGSDGIPGAIIIKPNKGVDIGAFEQVLKQKYRVFRGLKAGEPDNFFVNKLSGFADAINGIIATLNLIGWIISGFSLLVGGFGIANIMFVSVRERTNLIGIQKSLGAKNKFIMFQFLFEAVILSVMGGLIGIILVQFIAFIATMALDFEFILSFSNIFLGFSLSTLIGLISGVIPAITASRLDPVEAIRTGM
ncbi:ABC transporter permease [Psychroserpens sp.]|uniref:ABC transporter permease n=1 Tax=Psychroserpens sp. TaxID=2020870 RepID=UPI001B090BFE|nr:ABC transporter permease [Psychroserpens sp.]MBO6605974.1 ABC transporter permease [Psychroserpens sp.]MBO6630890.1 ABC transporter permease [Psychroserpens sp.]MBO6652655.1 ABC transporter permease [Psychroserpens sp.]MBO6681573.1 ABC transporter permease [Psychroserpens sp.]MBO6749348.1 ABC transporter permease [Psychroserpens sp.]